jgi:hypothetical protein
MNTVESRQTSFMHSALRKAAVVWWTVVFLMIFLALWVLVKVEATSSPVVATGIGVIWVAMVAHQYRGKKTEQAKARALSDVRDAITALAAVQGDEVRSARALHDAIRNAVLLDALPDEVDISLDKLNQLKKAVRAERAAADRRADELKAALWGHAWTATFATLVAIATLG